MKHTPAPWTCHVSVSTPYTADRKIRPSYVLNLVSNSTPPITEEEAEANRALIAAAPDMLEALKNIENDDQHMPSTAWEMIQAAIRKAEGVSRG